jgi:hypothetical protein
MNQGQSIENDSMVNTHLQATLGKAKTAEDVFIMVSYDYEETSMLKRGGVVEKLILFKDKFPPLNSTIPPSLHSILKMMLE